MALDTRIPLTAQPADLSGALMGGFKAGYGLAELGRERNMQAEAAAQERQAVQERLGMERERHQMAKQEFAASQEATQQQNAAAAFGVIARTAKAAKTPEQFATMVDALGENGIIKPEIAQKYRNAFDQRKAIAAWADSQAKNIPEAYDLYQRAQSDPGFAQYLEKQRQEAQADRLALANARGSDRVQTITTGDGVFVLNEDGSKGTRLGDAPNKAGGSVPATIIKMERDDRDSLGLLSGINNQLDTVLGQLNAKKLKLGPAENRINEALNAAGQSTETSRNYASFQATLEKLRNDSLRLNAGVQTDGDAQRAWNELFSNINDEGVVKQRLAEIKKLNERAAQIKGENLDSLYEQYPSLARAKPERPEATKPTAKPAGEATRPNDVPEDVWNEMTPEERALFR